MVSEILGWLDALVSSWKPWVVIAPWDVGVRVRLGRTASALPPGIHLRIPFLDDVTHVNTRLRVDSAPPVTIAAKVAGRARVVSPTVGYLIHDPLVAMLRFSTPFVAVLSVAQAEVSRGGTALEVEERLRAHFAGFGISIEFVRFVEDVEVRAFRLLNNHFGLGDGMGGPPVGSGGERRY